MTAHRITAEEMASLEQRLAEEDITFDFVREILDRLRETRAELDRLSAQGGEVPELDNYETRPCEPCYANEDPEDWCAIAQWESERADAWKAFAQLQARPAPPHPDTVNAHQEHALLAALKSIEDANDKICAVRSDKAYLESLKCDVMEDAMHTLDDARRAARELIRIYEGRPLFKSNTVEVSREELEILREIADIARPRVRKLDNAALCDATRRLDAVRRHRSGETEGGIG